MKHEHEISGEYPLMDGVVVRWKARKSGPRNFKAVGVVYAGPAAQAQFKADIEFAIKITDPTGLLPDALKAMKGDKDAVAAIGAELMRGILKGVLKGEV